MFETAEIGRAMSKEEFERRLPELRTGLLAAQRDLGAADFPVVVLVHGLEGAGKGDCVNRLLEWGDARYVQTVAFGPPTEEERQRPEHWRYWMALPPRGRLALFVGSWYSPLLRAHTSGKIDDAALAAGLGRVRALERTLVDDGMLLVKLWFHVSRAAQRARFEKLLDERETRWRVTKDDWKQHKRYDDHVRTAGLTLRETSTGAAPWTVIEASDARYRDATVAEAIVGGIRQRLAAPSRTEERRPPDPDVPNPNTIFDRLDLTSRLPREEYEAELPLLQGRLNKLARRVAKKGVGVTIVLEGPDAAGKGGAIRRVTHALDARQYRVIPIAAPTAEERSYHYLWRFWRHLPRLGRITIYDRSWYGRVLVERVEGFASEAEWQRAFKEINDFERQLVDRGIVLVKLWLQISAEEQLRRFQEREKKPWKQYKITPEDYRNRGKTNLYEIAANDMVAATSTEYAPWTLVEADDKLAARVKVLRTLCAALSAAL